VPRCSPRRRPPSSAGARSRRGCSAGGAPSTTRRWRRGSCSPRGSPSPSVQRVGSRRPGLSRDTARAYPGPRTAPAAATLLCSRSAACAAWALAVAPGARPRPTQRRLVRPLCPLPPTLPLRHPL